MVFFDMGEAFNMLRGKHLETAVIGGFEVSQKGDLASWTFTYPVPNSGISIGGGFDLVVGPKRLIVVVAHLDKNGQAKVVQKLHYPVTGARGHVDTIITDLAVFNVEGPKGNKRGLVLTEIAPDWTVDELRSVTEGEFEVSPSLKVYEL
jgi:3-oxoacid CoA-transferase B subunit